MKETETVGASTDRRKFLKYLGIAVAGAAAGAAVGHCIRTRSEATPKTATLTETVTEATTEVMVYPASLRVAAEARGLLVGSEVDQMALKDARFAATLAREFNSLTIASEMTWEQIDCCGYEPADAIVKFASEHHMKVKGHPLIDHRTLPGWVNPQISTGELRLKMQNHIREEVAHYRHRVYAWNVVNEAVDSDGLRRSILLEKLGDGYVADAFRLAHEADPDALLFYNDYDAEAAGGLQKAKSDRVYALVRKLVVDGVPIHGVGLQMHLFAVECPNPEDIAANVRRLAAQGLEVNISEMDVRIKDLPLVMSERLQMQRRIYHDVTAACIKEKGFMGVTFWGFTDAHTWVNEPGRGGPDYPLLFDENYQPKPAYWGVMDALLGR